MIRYKLSMSVQASHPSGALRYGLSMPNDPLFTESVQWHLGYVGSMGFTPDNAAVNTSGLEAVWRDYQGDGVAVGIWDDGVQRTHWDLAANYDASKQVIVKGVNNDGLPLTADDGHGTAVAGLIAGDDNGRGGVGIAHDARLTAVRIFGGADDINTNWSRYLLTLDSLKNFDVTNHSYGGTSDFRVEGDVAKFGAAAALGRGGLGTVNVKSAGNGNIDGNGSAIDASRFTVTVAAVGNDSTGNIAFYSSYGAHVLVSAPAAAVTTDLMGNAAGYNGLLDGDYTNSFGGTSAAGPVTAGVVALMLDANPGLGWRDVQNILAYSAVGVGSLYSGVTKNEDFAWQWNGADNWNGGGLHFSENYGYGMVNAFNAVRMAEVWGILYPQAATSATELNVQTGVISVGQKIADLGTLNYKFSVNQNVDLEHVALSVSLTHTQFTDLRIRLISPSGTVASLYDGSTGNGNTSDQTFTYAFGADGFRGEAALGTWTLQVQDARRSNSGELKSVSFSAYGSKAVTDSVYHYTSEALSAQSLNGPAIDSVLTDADGGTDWIDAVCMSDPLLLCLTAGASSTVGGVVFMTIASDSRIENAIGGDGNDRIEGNALDNLIYGMRGDDTLVGDDGFDIAAFMGLSTEYTVSILDDKVLVSGLEGSDTLFGFERLHFADLDVAIAPVGEPPADLIAPTLLSCSPTDNSTDVTSTAQIVLSFSEPVQAGSGLVSIYQDSGTLFQSFSSSDLTFSGSSVVIAPSIPFALNTNYHVLVQAGAIQDLSGNAFAGISNPANLNFTTETGTNSITGTKGNDRLTGTSGIDLIRGLDGSDVINGKLGSDILQGGGGRDYFVFDTPLSPNNVDVLNDFHVRDDTIHLDNAIFSKLTSTGALNANLFRANAGGVAQDGNDYILMDTLTESCFTTPMEVDLDNPSNLRC